MSVSLIQGPSRRKSTTRQFKASTSLNTRRDGSWRCAEALSLWLTVCWPGGKHSPGGKHGPWGCQGGSCRVCRIDSEWTTPRAKHNIPTTWLDAKLLATPVPSTPPTINITNNIERSLKTIFSPAQLVLTMNGPIPSPVGSLTTRPSAGVTPFIQGLASSQLGDSRGQTTAGENQGGLEEG